MARNMKIPKPPANATTPAQTIGITRCAVFVLAKAYVAPVNAAVAATTNYQNAPTPSPLHPLETGNQATITPSAATRSPSAMKRRHSTRQIIG